MKDGNNNLLKTPIGLGALLTMLERFNKAGLKPWLAVPDDLSPDDRVLWTGTIEFDGGIYERMIVSGIHTGLS